MSVHDARFGSPADHRLGQFEALYDAHGRSAFGLAYSILRDPTEAEDVVQDAFLAAWRAGIPMEPASPGARSWLLRIVHNRAIDVRRHAGRRPAVQLDNDTDVPSDAPDVPLQAGQAIDAETVSRCLSNLPPEQRQVLELAYFSGLTHVEIAAQARLPLGTVKSRIRLALDRLRAMLNVGQDATMSA